MSKIKKKFEFTGETKKIDGHILHRIKSLFSFSSVTCGEIGGWVEKESNLSHIGDAWVYGDAWVCGDAMVYGNARVYGNAMVSGNAMVYNKWSLKAISNLGSRNSTLTYTNSNKKYTTGCFSGTADELKEKLKNSESIVRNEYMCVIDFIEKLYSDNYSNT